MASFIEKFIASAQEKKGVELHNYLEANADEVEEMDYYLNFTPKELQTMGAELVQHLVKVRGLEEKKRKLTDPIDIEMKVEKKLIKSLTQTLAEKRESRSGEVFVIHDEETLTSYYISPHGDIVHKQPLRSPRQSSIYTAMRTGTND